MKYTYILLLLSLFVNKCNSILKLYDNFNNELASFYNVDFPKENNAGYINVTGNLFVASFRNEKDTCKISGLPNDVDVLVVPFRQAFKLGCKSYANLLSSNSWTETKTIKETERTNDGLLYLTRNPKDPKGVDDKNDDNSSTTDNNDNIIMDDANSEPIARTPIIESSIIQTKETLLPLLPLLTHKTIYEPKEIEVNLPNISKEFRKRELASNAPKAIIFSSFHNGIPGIREQYNGEIRILRTATPGLTLMNIEDTEKLIEMANEVTYVELTAEQGPWIELIQSKSWKAFSIVLGVLYLIIVMITMFLIPKTYMNLGCALSNPKFWIYSGLGIISVCRCLSFLILEIDPGDIYQDKLSIFAREILTDLKNFLIAILYTILHISWKIVTKKICKERGYYTFPIIDGLFKIIQPISALTFMICFVLRVVYADKSNFTPMDLLKVAYIMESTALGLIGLGFLVFGSLKILALRRLQRRRQRIIRNSKQLSKIGLMTLFMIISIVVYIGSKAFKFLVLTVENYKIEQISHHVITVFYCLIMIYVLEDKYIGRYLPSNKEDNLKLPNTITLTSISSSDGPPQPPPQSEGTDIELTDIEDPDKIEIEEVNRSESVNMNV